MLYDKGKVIINKIKRHYYYNNIILLKSDVIGELDYITKISFDKM